MRGFKFASNLRFAGDIVLIANDPQKLQAMVRELITESGKFGLALKNKVPTFLYATYA